MATTAKRSIKIVYSGDLQGTEDLDAANNAASPGETQLLTLASGLNTITVPTGGSTPTCCVVIPPTSNTTSITLKGVTGDTGIRLHNTDPTAIALHSSVTTFALTTGGAITGVRLMWT